MKFLFVGISKIDRKEIRQRKRRKPGNELRPFLSGAQKIMRKRTNQIQRSDSRWSALDLLRASRHRESVVIKTDYRLLVTRPMVELAFTEALSRNGARIHGCIFNEGKIE